MAKSQLRDSKEGHCRQYIQLKPVQCSLNDLLAKLELEGKSKYILVAKYSVQQKGL